MKHLKKGGAKDALLSLFFPPCCPSCGRSVGREENFCPECSRELYIPLPGKLCPRCGKSPCICEELDPPYLHTWAAAYYEGAIQRAVRRFKFHSHPGSARVLGRMMADVLPKPLADDGKRFDQIVPVPMRPRREKARGYNQAALLAQEVSRRIGVPCQNALKKIRDTKAQHDLTEEERQKNLSGSLLASPEVSGKRILLVDDVLTTGSTAKEAARALLAAEAESVDVLVLSITRLKKD